MLIKKPADVKSSEITPEKNYLNRRNFIKAGILAGSAVATGALYRAVNQPPPDVAELAEIAGVGNNRETPNVFGVDEPPTLYKDITTYNNYYEFGTGKDEPARAAAKFAARPWTISIDGLVNKPKTFDLEELLRFEQEERTYRFRCVEGWSMVIPWIGFSLKTLLDKVEPLGAARFVAFETVFRPAEMPNQRNRFGFGSADDASSSASENGVLDFPYVEGLRLDEAVHPLTILATGLYGKVLPNQNGAPVRLVVPWKYGFKGIKSIVKITLTDKQPPTTWNLANRREYGFYSNVNPKVSHPRWSQATEQRIGEFQRRETLMFNGYAEQVAQLYDGMDLRKNF